MDGRYGSLASQNAAIENMQKVKRQRKPKALSLGVTFLILFIVIVVSIVVGYLYWRVAPSTVFSRNLLVNAQNNNSRGPTIDVGDGNLGAVCIADSDCGVGFECSNDECCFFGNPIITNVQTNLGVPGSSTIVVDYNFGPSIRAGTIVEIVLETPTGVQLANKIENASGSITITESNFSVPIQIIFSNTLYVVRIRITYSCGSVQNATTPFTPPLTFNTGSCAPAPIGITGYSTQFGTYGNFFGTAAEINDFTTFRRNFLVSNSPGLHPNLAQTVYQNIVFTLGVSTTFGVLFFFPLPYLTTSGNTVYVRSFTDQTPSGCYSNLSPEVSYTA